MCYIVKTLEDIIYRHDVFTYINASHNHIATCYVRTSYNFECYALFLYEDNHNVWYIPSKSASIGDVCGIPFAVEKR